MTKSDIVEHVFERDKEMSKKQACECVEMVFELIKAELATGNNVKISGFGSFSVRRKRERTGRNPQTGEPMTISARKVVSFKSSQILNKVLNRPE